MDVDATELRAYRDGVDSLEGHLVRWWARERAEDRAATTDVGTPEGAYEEAVAKELPRFARQVLELIATDVKAEAKGRTKFRKNTTRAGKAASGEMKDLAAGPKPKLRLNPEPEDPDSGAQPRPASHPVANTAKVGVDSAMAAYQFYTIVAEGGELHEQMRSSRMRSCWKPARPRSTWSKRASRP